MAVEAEVDPGDMDPALFELSQVIRLALLRHHKWFATTAGVRTLDAVCVPVAEEILGHLEAAPGPVERQVREDIGELAKAYPLTGGRGSQAQIAFRMARALDVERREGAVGLSGAARELAASLERVWKGVPVERASDRAVAGLGKPVRKADVSA